MSVELGAERVSRAVARAEIVDVAIVGYGPVGATLANILGSLGLSVEVFERESDVFHQPRAGHLDGEVMRIFQSIGLAAEIESRAVVNPGMKFVNADGKLLLDWPRPMQIGPDGWYPSYRFHQPYLEQALRRGAGRFGNVRVQLRTDVFALDLHQDRVGVRFEDMKTGQLKSIEARFVIGCDGARSLVRRLMGTTVEDMKSHERWVVVDLLMKHPRADLPAVTLQLCDPSRPTTVIRMVENRRRWELKLMPGDDPAQIVKPETVWRLLSKWVSPDEAEIERAIVYTFHSVIVNGWRNGRMLLAGDACHQTPPFMGQGMCAGIRDAANLGWKLAAVLAGKADDSLLDTYESERKPHVRSYIETAVNLGSIIHVTDPALVAKRDAELATMPKKMESLRIALGPGLNANHPLAGQLCRQVELTTGARLDDMIGNAFGILVHSSVADEPAVQSVSSPRLEFRLVVDPAVDRYLEELSVLALIVRPDRYLLGAAHNAGDIAPALAVLEQCGLAGRSTPAHAAH